MLNKNSKSYAFKNTILEIAIIFLACIVFHGHANIPRPRHRYQFCENQIADGHPDSWLTDNVAPSGWYFQYGSRVVRQQLASFLKTENLSDNEDEYTGFCARVTFLPIESGGKKYLTGDFRGFKFFIAAKNCSYVEGGGGYVICENTNEGQPQHKMYTGQVPIWLDRSDRHNYKIIVYCFDNGQNGWVVISKSKSLSDEEDTDIYYRVQSLGYNPSDRVTFKDPTCSQCKAKIKKNKPRVE